jgi:hypothetical protein
MWQLNTLQQSSQGAERAGRREFRWPSHDADACMQRTWPAPGRRGMTLTGGSKVHDTGATRDRKSGTGPAAAGSGGRWPWRRLQPWRSSTQHGNSAAWPMHVQRQVGALCVMHMQRQFHGIHFHFHSCSLFTTSIGIVWSHDLRFRYSFKTLNIWSKV